MFQNWQPVLYDPDDEEELVALSQHQPGKAGIVTAKYIRWQNHGNPAGLATVAVAKEIGSNKIIGQVWMLPLRFQVGGEIQLGSMACYALVHPAYQRQGVFTRLMPYCYEMASQAGIRFCYGIPNPKTFAVKVGRLNWAHIGNAGFFMRALNSPRLAGNQPAKGIALSAMAAAGRAAGNLISRSQRNSPALTDFDIEILGGDEARIDAFWERVKDKYAVMVVRDSRFLSWRYHQVPERKYLIGSASEDGTIHAYIVLRCALLKGFACGMIVDFLVEPTSLGQAAGASLLHWATDIFLERQMDLMGCLMLPGVEEIRLLRRQGFIRCPTRLLPQPLPVILQSNGDFQGHPLLCDPGNWFLTMGDWDAV